MGALLEDDFSLEGLSLAKHPGKGVGDHLFFSTPAWDATKDGGVALVGHHDTVFPPGAFECWDLDDKGILNGPGVLDMKGGLVVIHTALSALARCGLLADVPLCFISVADEEIGSPHSRELSLSLCRKASTALVFEGGRDRDMIITQRKGTGRFDVTATGRAAHAGNHHKEGVNAIRLLSRFVEAAEALTDYPSGTTVNVGLIAGGEATNTVPAHAECNIDFRFEDPVAGDKLIAAVQELPTDAPRELGGSIAAAGGVRRPPWGKTEAGMQLFQKYASCAEAAGLGSDESPLCGGGSDGNHLAAAGLAVIDGLGPRGKGFHTHKEWIEVSTLAQKTDALLRFLLR